MGVVEDFNDLLLWSPLGPVNLHVLRPEEFVSKDAHSVREADQVGLGADDHGMSGACHPH